MNEILSPLAPALVALFGTLTVALLGYYQWSRVQRRGREDPFLKARAEAYRGLWATLEEVNVKLRDGSLNNPQLFDLLREVNAYFLQNSLYFNPEEQALINQYMNALQKLRAAIYTEGNEDVINAFESTVWPASVSARVDPISAEVAHLRERILSIVKRAVTS